MGVMMKYTVSDIRNKSMTKGKKDSAKNDIIAFYIGRPLSYLLTIPCLYLKIQPNTVSFVSLFFPIMAFISAYIAQNFLGYLMSWVFLFIWNLLDGVDGNIARYTKNFSKIGSLWDATSGYFAMFFTYSTFGLLAYKETEIVDYLILGFLSGMACIMPRLIMHKKLNESNEKNNELKDKAHYSLMKVIALNLTSVSGGAQFLALIALLIGMIQLYTGVYFFFNTVIMIISMYKLLRV